jgi:predicted alpha/beta superfamily hydrolase
MTIGSAIGAWSFHPLISSFPPTVLPNIQYWNITNGTWEYQVQISYPLNWTSPNATSIVDTLYSLPLLNPTPKHPTHDSSRYVLDGNALAQTATETPRKRRPVDSVQPDTIIVSIGYPSLIPDSPYSEGRYHDYQMPVCPNCSTPELPGVPSNGDNFLAFIDDVLRPWVRRSVFPNARFDRDALYGHSFAGLFTVYTLLVRPEMFDVYLAASPFLIWNNEYIFSPTSPLHSDPPPSSFHQPNSTAKPALQLSYGGLEKTPRKRRTETQEEFEARRDFLVAQKYAELAERLYGLLRGSARVRDVELNVYPFSYHAAVGGAALADGLDYFLDW